MTAPHRCPYLCQRKCESSVFPFPGVLATSHYGLLWTAIGLLYRLFRYNTFTARVTGYLHCISHRSKTTGPFWMPFGTMRAKTMPYRRVAFEPTMLHRLATIHRMLQTDRQHFSMNRPSDESMGRSGMSAQYGCTVNVHK